MTDALTEQYAQSYANQIQKAMDRIAVQTRKEAFKNFIVEQLKIYSSNSALNNPKFTESLIKKLGWDLPTLETEQKPAQNMQETRAGAYIAMMPLMKEAYKQFPEAAPPKDPNLGPSYRTSVAPDLASAPPQVKKRRKRKEKKAPPTSVTLHFAAAESSAGLSQSKAPQKDNGDELNSFIEFCIRQFKSYETSLQTKEENLHFKFASKVPARRAQFEELRRAALGLIAKQEDKKISIDEFIKIANSVFDKVQATRGTSGNDKSELQQMIDRITPLAYVLAEKQKDPNYPREEGYDLAIFIRDFNQCEVKSQKQKSGIGFFSSNKNEINPHIQKVKNEIIPLYHQALEEIKKNTDPNIKHLAETESGKKLSAQLIKISKELPKTKAASALSSILLMAEKRINFPHPQLTRKQ